MEDVGVRGGGDGSVVVVVLLGTVVGRLRTPAHVCVELMLVVVEQMVVGLLALLVLQERSLCRRGRRR